MTKHNNSKPMGCSKSSSKKEIYKILAQETRKISNNLTLHLKQPEREGQQNPQISRRKEIIKIRAGINEREMKETIVKINKTKIWFFEKINKIDKHLFRLKKKKEREREESNEQN